MLRNRQRDRFGIGSTNNFGILLACLVAITLTRGSIAPGAMILTPEGISRGLTLSTFASGFPTNGPGPFTYLPDGRIMVVDSLGRLQIFNNVNGQNAASSPVITTFSAPPLELTVSGSQTYGMNGHSVVRIDANSGAILNTVFSGGPGDSQYQALATNPVNGWLLVSHWGYGVYQVNPATGQNNPPFGGGVGIEMSVDGAYLYAAVISGNLYRYNVGGGGTINYGTMPGNYPTWPTGALNCSAYDVTLGYGPLSGRLYTSCLDGTIWELNLQTLARTQIASGGTAAYRIAVDPSHNGDILVSQADRILRLSGIPEPASLSLLAIGGLVIFRRRSRS